MISRKAAAALGLAALAGCAGAFLALRARSSAPTVPARRGPIVEAVYGLGTVTAARSYQLRIPVGGTVRQVWVREGDRVAAGAPLITLDQFPTFNAPFRGTVTFLPFKANESVAAQSVVLAMADLADRYLVVSLEQQGALRVRAGQGAVLSFESMRAQKFNGRVRAIVPNEGQFLVYLDVAGLPPEILPGMTADTAIEISRKTDALLVPAAAVSMGRIVIVSGRHRRKVQVQIGLVDGEWAEVLEGDVRAGTPVAVPRR